MARTHVDVVHDNRRWTWVMPSALSMSESSAARWYASICDALQNSDRIEAAYFGADRGLHAAAQKQMADALDTTAPLPADGEVLALAMVAVAEERLQWIRMFWVVYGPVLTLEALSLATCLRWTGDDDCSWAIAAECSPNPPETDFARGLVNSLGEDEREQLTNAFQPRFQGSQRALWMSIFPGPNWVENALDDRSLLRAASMVASHNEAARLLSRISHVDLELVGELVVNLLDNHGHGKTMRLLGDLVDAHPSVLAALPHAFEDTLESVAACSLVAQDLDVGGEYLRRHPQHAIEALSAIEHPTDEQQALLLELHALPGPRETAETISYWPLGWEVIDEELVANGPGDFGSWGELPIHVVVHDGLVGQLDEDNPRAGLDLLQPDQRDTLQFVVAQWMTVALVCGPILDEHGAAPLKIVIRDDDEPSVFGVAAQAGEHDEHGIGIRMKSLAVLGVGQLASVL